MNQPTDTTSKLLPDPDLSGQVIGDYHILRRLGSGAMAEVYLADQTSLRRQVAFKVLRRSLTNNTSYVQRFRHEAQAAAALIHANIVQIHEVNVHRDIHYIVQEYVPGQNLKQYLTRNGAIDCQLAVQILCQVADALHKAAEHGIIHRDIKPENIMLASSGEVKVADFGLARTTASGDVLALTEVGITMGTPLYMSPEQAEGKKLDPRSDIYSLGATCYHLLAGRPPFVGDTALSVAVQHLQNEPNRLEACRPDLPAAFCHILHQMLAKSPEKRYANAADLISDLRSLNLTLHNELDLSAELEKSPQITWDSNTTAQAERTQQLSTLMKTDSLEQTNEAHRTRRVGILLALIMGMAFTVGAVIAWSTSEAPLLKLTPQEQADLVNEFDTINEQYQFARLVDTEIAWRNVWEKFDEHDSDKNKRFATLARQHLAWRYVQLNDFDAALGLFSELAQLDSSQLQFRSQGLAGQAIVLGLKGEYENSTVKIIQLKNNTKMWRSLGSSIQKEIEDRHNSNQRAQAH